MKALSIIGGIFFTLGFLGMISVNDQHEYWWALLLGSFAMFLVGFALLAFISNRYSVYASAYAIVAMTAAYLYPIMSNREFPTFCRKLWKKCGGSYKKMYHTVRSRYFEHMYEWED